MNKTVVITGASKGIGFELTKKFLDNNFAVIGTCRDGIIDCFSHKRFNSIKLDLSDFDTITAAASEIQSKMRNIDILINNAGIGPDSDKLLPEIESFDQTFAVNTRGTVFLTELILKLMNDKAKIINISSKMGSIQLCDETDSVAYRMSKAALNMYSKILSNRLKENQFVATIHPGWVRTNLAPSNINAPLSATESAAKIYGFINGDFENGTFWNVDTNAELEW